jgi:hypothetical protein
MPELDKGVWKLEERKGVCCFEERDRVRVREVGVSVFVWKESEAVALSEDDML